MELKNWISKNSLQAEFIEDNKLYIEGVGAFLLLSEKEGKIFNGDFNLIISDEERKFNEEIYIDGSYYLFNFGGNYYYTSTEETKKPELKLFKYLGTAVQELEIPFTHLGLHGKYELFNIIITLITALILICGIIFHYYNLD